MKRNYLLLVMWPAAKGPSKCYREALLKALDRLAPMTAMNLSNGMAVLLTTSLAAAQVVQAVESHLARLNQVQVFELGQGWAAGGQLQPPRELLSYIEHLLSDGMA